MTTTVKNLTNSPHDLAIILPAMGEVTAVFSPHYLAALEGMGCFEIIYDVPLVDVVDDHEEPTTEVEAAATPAAETEVAAEGAGEDGSALTAADEAELLDAMTDDELRAFIEKRTGKKAHHATGHEKLLEKAKEAAATPAD